MKLNKFLFTIPWVCITLAFIQNNRLYEIIRPGSKLEKLAEGMLISLISPMTE